MVVIDTNILVRYATRDDPQQASIATTFLCEHECLVLCTVLLELVWVLSSGYKLTRETIVERVRHILCLPTLSTENVDNVLLALEWYEQGMDFGDALHLAASPMESEGFATFDKGIKNMAHRLNLEHSVILIQ
jgi:predicted nucleic-acid-binding protein